MINSIYCKINEFHAKFRLLDQILLSNNTKLLSDSFALKREFGESYPIIAEHIHCLSKAEVKVPAWVNTGCIFCKKTYEQGTSEQIANYKASIFPNQSILSITGGMGVDDVAFAQNGCSVTSLDPDEGINALFEYNQKKLGTQVDRITITAESYLEKNNHSYELIYADPDRRPKGDRTGGWVEQHEPDVFALYTKYKSISPNWLLKLSPMTDVAWLLSLPNILMDIAVIVQAQEVKELLCHVHDNAKGNVKLVVIGMYKISEFSSIGEVESSSYTIFCEAQPGAIKAGLNKRFAEKTQLNAENLNDTYFTGTTLLPQELARSFRLMEKVEGGLNKVSEKLKAMNIDSANISSRDYVLKTEDIRKKLNLKDGGEVYLFFTGRKEKTCFVCRKF